MQKKCVTALESFWSARARVREYRVLTEFELQRGESDQHNKEQDEGQQRGGAAARQHNKTK